MSNPRATKLEWLEYFYDRADFGPAHEDVVGMIQDEFEDKTGKLVPEGYRYGDHFDAD